MRFGLIGVLITVWPAAASASVMDFDDLVIWAGTGSNEAAMVVDWRDGQPALAWGYRWDGAATGEDMFRAIAAADDDFYGSINDTFAFGNFINGIGYDRDGDGFDVTPALSFNADGLHFGASAVDVVSDDADDSYRGSSSTFEFWEYFVSVGNPYDGGSWSSAAVGFSDRNLTDGDWDAWVFPGFVGNLPSDTPLAAGGTTAVPEPSTWAAFAVLSFGYVVRRLRRRSEAAS